jgi:hypothetical protein
MFLLAGRQGAANGRLPLPAKYLVTTTKFLRE